MAALQFRGYSVLCIHGVHSQRVVQGSKVCERALSVPRRDSTYQAPLCMKKSKKTGGLPFSVKQEKKTGGLHSDWWATQRPRYEDQPRGCALMHEPFSCDVELPFYVKIAIDNELPAGWTPTGLAESIKIKVLIGKNWWQLPKVHAECVFGQLIYKNTTIANYAWCWGDTRTRPGSWRPHGPDMETNINRYMIDAEKRVQFNIDNGRKREVMFEGASDETPEVLALVTKLGQCKL